MSHYASKVRPGYSTSRRWFHLTLVISLVWLVGCANEPRFRVNAVHKLTVEKEFLDGEEIPEAQMEQLGNVMTALFGTPSDPHFPAGNESWINPDHLASAAGPVSSDAFGKARGLYREHCAHCHGITGDGAGPTASFLNPYPRDFRLGKFKFKSTKMFRPPTDEDIHRVLTRGIAGTAMPSFALLNEEELNSLVTYVKYLSIRGQVERVLLEELANLDEGDQLMAPKESVSADDYEYQMELVMESVDPILNRWKKAESQVVPVPDVPEHFRSKRKGQYYLIGQQLFFGKANCVQCHGETGVGDGQTENHDDWTNEWLKRGNVDLNDPEDLKAYIEAGALKPRKIRPRNLRYRVFRGGSGPEDLYRRIAAGIEGTSMPAAPNLSEEEIWALIAYILELPFTDETTIQGGQ